MKFLAELHCHTRHSDGFASPAGCIRWARRRGLQVLAITDHNTAAAGLPYRQQPLVDGVYVIAGEEVSTEVGHVLAYFLQRSIAPGPLAQVLAEIRAQGALAFLAHPYHIPLGNRWRKKRILKATAEQIASLDGIEITNGHNRGPANRLAAELAQRQKLAVVAGSDAHLPFEIGNVPTELEANALDEASLRAAMLSGSLRPRPRRWNAYAVYLAVGLLNRLLGVRYDYRAMLAARGNLTEH